MKTQHIPIAIGVLILFLTIPAAVYLSTQPEALQTLTQAGKETSAVYYLWPAEINSVQDEPFELRINLASPEREVTEAQTVLSYDPQMLDVQEIKKGAIFAQYTKESLDTSKGQIQIAGQGIFQGSGTFATVVFIPKKSGNSNLDLIKSGSQVLDTEKANILQGVNGSEVEIE